MNRRTSPLRLEMFYLTGAHLADGPGTPPPLPPPVADDSTASADDALQTNAVKRFTDRIDAEKARLYQHAECIVINNRQRVFALEYEPPLYMLAAGGAR